MVTNHTMESHSSSKIYQKELYYKLGIWHLNLTHKIKTRWQLLWMVSGQLQYLGWSHPIQNLTEGSVLQTCNLAHRLNHKIKTRWQWPSVVSYHSLDGHPPSQGQGWSPSIPRLRMFTQNLQNGHPASPGWAPINLMLVTHYSKSPSQMLLPSFPIAHFYILKTDINTKILSTESFL